MALEIGSRAALEVIKIAHILLVVGFASSVDFPWSKRP
jgi:hypothetical protein